MILCLRSLNEGFIYSYWRGIGGDAVTALNIAHALSKYGVECNLH
jgi:hypothetical protein